LSPSIPRGEGARRERVGTHADPASEPFDVFVSGRPSVDVVFSDLAEWPLLGKDVDAGSLGVCAGTSFNTPAAANRLGMRVAYAAAIGNDVWSEIVLEEFRTERLGTDFLRVADRPLPFVSVAMNLDGDRGFVTYYGPDERDDQDLAAHATEVLSTIDARHMHGYAAEQPSDVVKLARARGMTVSLDAWGGPRWEPAAPLDRIAELADVLFANEPEALAMTAEDDVVRAGRRLGELVPCAVIKRGSLGALGVTVDGLYEVPAEPARTVDATGAGDCFNAGFLFGWLRQLSTRDSLTLGAICGARAVETFGGYRGCPDEDQLGAAATAHGIELTTAGEWRQ
jgi:sugar/nucleoside kinase (ribokinase family)